MIRILEDGGEEGNRWRPEYLNRLKEVFRKDGHLVRHLNFEHRPEQESMALGVGRSLLDGSHLVVEAGTGVGKSLAYLIPAILFARSSKRPCVVATNTISLQEQLLQKDVPAVRDLFNRTSGLDEFADFRCALLVGRANYLCTNRLNRALRGQTELFDNRQRDELERIADWAQSGPAEGIRQEINPIPTTQVWESVNADSSLCSAKRCHPDTCFYRRARSIVERAEVVIVNHSLLFSLMSAGMSPEEEESGILFPSDFVIFDEAHEMPEVASEHLGVSLSSRGLENFLARLYNPRNGKGLIAKNGRPSDIAAVEEVKVAVEDFFQYLHLEALADRDKVRLTQGHSFPMEVFPSFGRFLRSLVELVDLQKDELKKLEIKDQVKRAQGYLSSLSEVIERKNTDHVYWIERAGTKKHLIHLRGAPLEVAKELQDGLFGRGVPVVMTSATLTRKGSTEYFNREVGVLKTEQSVLQSPFDYQANMKIRILSDAPNPMTNDRAPYLNFLCKSIFQLARSIEGGTLVLFTNYADLRHCYGQIRTEWSKTHRSIYAQGEEFSRSELRKRMIEDGDALLLGAESFWKGFDAKGACLSQVVLTRLPFDNPNHPLKEARAERVESLNLNPFREITIPGAVMRFRQGIGRLIRSRSDCGDLVILDSRILRQSYGKDFLSELPHQAIELVSQEEIIGDSGERFDNDIDF